MYHTFDEWSAKGYRILKGQKAEWIDGVAKFSKYQVWRPEGPTRHQKKTYRFINRGDDYYREMDEFYGTDYFH